MKTGTKKVEAGIAIQVEPALALEAFTEAQHLGGWWAVERSLVEKVPGGSYALAWGISENGIKYVSSGTVHEYLPGERLVVKNFCYFNPDKDILGGLQLTVEVSKM